MTHQTSGLVNPLYRRKMKRPLFVRNFSARSVVDLEETYDASKVSRVQRTFHEFLRHLLLYLDVMDLTNVRLVSFYFYNEANGTNSSFSLSCSLSQL